MDITYDEYNKIYYSNYKTESWWPDRWIASAHILAEYATNRPIFENLFDKSQLDMDSDAYKFHYALMYPESEESIEYFRNDGGIENYYFPQNTGHVATRPKHVPKCPICGSENLTRLTTMKKAAKIALERWWEFMDLAIVERRGNAIIVVASFDMIKARPNGLAFSFPDI